MKRTPEFILVCIPAAWQTLLIVLLALVPFLTRRFSGIIYHPAASLVFIHLSIAAFLWIAAFQIRKGKMLWGIMLLIIGSFLTIFDFYNALFNVLLVISGLMILLRHPENRPSTDGTAKRRNS